jgi:hypothetical protein
MSSKSEKEKQDITLKNLKERLKLRKSLSYKDYVKQAIDRGEKEYKNAFKSVGEIKRIEL